MAILNSNGSRSDTQTQVTAANSGDTVLLPAAGSFTWSSGDVTIPNTKWIILDGNGSTVNITGSILRLNPASSGVAGHVTRITNFNFTGAGGSAGEIEVNDTATSSPWRIDHCTWACNGTDNLNPLLNVNGRSSGLVDHFTVTNIPGSKEWCHINGWSNVDKTGWTTDSGTSLAGSANMVYFEDCTFTTRVGAANNSWIQGYYGARACIRYCNFNYHGFDSHGSGGNIGMRWWELNNNTLNNVPGDNQGYVFSLRAGSGVVFDNDGSGLTSGDETGMCEEDSGYPALWQIGRGLSTVGSNPTSGSDLALDPAYYWDNTSLTLAVNECEASEQPNMVQIGRDVYESARPGYTAYPYPNPLQGADPGDVDLTVTNLTSTTMTVLA